MLPPTLDISISKPSLPQSSSTPPSPIFSSPSALSSTNSDQGLHRRKSSVITERSPVLSSSGSAASPCRPNIPLNTLTFDSTPHSQIEETYNESSTSSHLYKQHHSSINTTTELGSEEQTTLHFIANCERNTVSLATLGPDPYADVKSGMIGNQSDDTSPHQNQNNFQNDVMRSSNIEVRLEDGSGVNYQKTCYNTRVQPSAPFIESIQQLQAAQQVKQKSRLQSLDILRGITIVFMVLVNTQGADPFEQLAHTEWFGYTLADWVYPNFIFMVGMSVSIVLSPKILVSMSRADSSSSRTGTAATTTISRLPFWKRHQSQIGMNLKIVKRSVLLFGIGISLSTLELVGEPLETRWVRIPGVLQRISFCYLVLATTVLWSPVRYRKSNPYKYTNTPLNAFFDASLEYLASRRVQFGLPLVCTTLWFILTYAVQSTATVTIPGCTYPAESQSPDGQILAGTHPLRGQLFPQWCTAQAFLDTVLFAREHDPNNPVFDSEGTIGNLMAVVTAWFGWMIGTSILEQQQLQKANESRLIQEVKIQTIIKKDACAKDCALSIDHPRGGGGDSLDLKQFSLDRLYFERRSLLLAHLGKWFMTGVCAMFLGTILGWFLPICKGLWTPSFTLYSAGISINTLCILMYIFDVTQDPSTQTSSTILSGDKKARFFQTLIQAIRSSGHMCTHLLICYGRNPTLVYVLTNLVKLILEKIHVDGKHDWIQSAWSFIFFNSFITFMSPTWASLVFSLVYILIFAPLVWYLNKKSVFLRV